MFRRSLGGIALAAMLATPALGQVCADLPATTLADWISSNKMMTFSIGGTLNAAWNAYLSSPSDQALENVLFELGMGGVGMSVPGLGILIKAGRVSISGTEYTIEEAKRLQLDAFMCGGVSGGERLPGIGFFETGGAQSIAPGITCANFADRVTSIDQFQRLERLFKGFYTKTILELGGRANEENYREILNQQWQVVDRTWKARTGARILEQIRAELRQIADAAREAEQCKAPPDGVSGPHYALIKVENIRDSVPAGWQTTVDPGLITFQASFGHSTCTWTQAPETVGKEGFTIDLSVEATSMPNARYSTNIDIRAGFGPPLNKSPTAAVVSVDFGKSEKKSLSLQLPGPNLDHVPAGSKIFMTVGGCNAGFVRYTYEYRDG